MKHLLLLPIFVSSVLWISTIYYSFHCGFRQLGLNLFQGSIQVSRIYGFGNDAPFNIGIQNYQEHTIPDPFNPSQNIRSNPTLDDFYFHPMWKPFNLLSIEYGSSRLPFPSPTHTKKKLQSLIRGRTARRETGVGRLIKRSIGA